MTLHQHDLPEVKECRMWIQGYLKGHEHGGHDGFLQGFGIGGATGFILFALILFLAEVLEKLGV